MQLQSLTHFKLLMELQEIFPHFSNYSFYCGDVQGVAVHMSVQKIDVLQVLNKEKMIFRGTVSGTVPLMKPVSRSGSCSKITPRSGAPGPKR